MIIARAHIFDARVITAAVLAGLIGGTALLLGSTVGTGETPMALLARIPGVLLPGTVFSPEQAAVYGALAHFAVSVGWAWGFAALALQMPILVRAPYIAGFSFGAVVEMFMAGMLVMVGTFILPQPAQFLRDFLAHTIGFGIPVAFIVSRMLAGVSHTQAGGAAAPQ